MADNATLKPAAPLTPAMLSGIDAATSQGETYRHVAHSHIEFVDWARANGVDDRIIDFLASRDDCAGTSAAAWVRLGRTGASAWFRGLPEDQRRTISRGLIGDDAFRIYVEWVLDNPSK